MEQFRVLEVAEQKLQDDQDQSKKTSFPGKWLSVPLHSHVYYRIHPAIILRTRNISSSWSFGPFPNPYEQQTDQLPRLPRVFGFQTNNQSVTKSMTMSCDQETNSSPNYCCGKPRQY